MKFVPSQHLWTAVSCVAYMIIMGATTSCTRVGTGPPPMFEFPPLVPSEQLENTNVLPHTQVAITPGRNLVYCATFQIAWNELLENLGQGPIRLSGDHGIVDHLNLKSFSKSDLDASSYLARAGLVRDGIVEQIGRELKEKFPEVSLNVPPAETGAAIYAYAYLQKNLAFGTHFNRLEDSLYFQQNGDSVAVTAFGIKRFEFTTERDSRYREQVTIHDYESEDDFVIQLNTTSVNDELVLAKIPAKHTLSETITEALQRVKGSDAVDYDKRLRSGESLVIPIVTLNVNRNYAELVGKNFLNPGLTGLRVTQATQGIRFRLDELGATLSANASVVAKGSDVSRRRQFVFDKPFLVYLKQKKSKVPYFAIWIETTELLTPASNSSRRTSE